MPKVHSIPIAVCGIWLLVVAAASAGTLTLDMETVPSTICDTEWVEDGITMSLTTTTAQDEYATPECFIFNALMTVGENMGPYYGPARLVVDLSGVSGIQSIEIDIYEAHFAGSTRAFIYNGETTLESDVSDQMQHQTLVLTPNEATVDRLAVSAHEAAVWEIRLMGDSILADRQTSFGAIKSFYR